MHRLALIPLVLSTACVASGGDEGFEILYNLAPSSASCSIVPGGAVLSGGVIEVTSPVGYLFTPEISSRITTVEGQSAFQRTVALRGARVELVNTATNATISKHTALFSSSLPPGGKVAASFTIVPKSVLEGLAPDANRIQLLAKVTPYGALGGTGDEVDGVEFQYPISVCDYRQGSCVAALPSPPTCPLPTGTMVGTPNGCNAYQDGAVTCCLEADNSLTCPGRVGTTALR